MLIEHTRDKTRELSESNQDSEIAVPQGELGTSSIGCLAVFICRVPGLRVRQVEHRGHREAVVSFGHQIPCVLTHRTERQLAVPPE